MAAILAQAQDRGSLSDELHFSASTVAERRHLDHGSANVLRGLTIAANAVVLEVGAEYGALTRYLGEQAATVHAIEPDARRAEAAATRAAGLDNVRVIDGTPAELPRDVEYDLAVVAAEFATPGFMQAVGARLRRDGVICVLVEGISGRREVEAALRAAGWTAGQTLRCVPDHWVARAVLAEDLLREHPRLADAIAAATGHGYLMLAGHRAEDIDTVWPAERLGTYFNTAERAARWCTRADVVRTAAGAEVRRVPLQPGPRPVGGISVRSYTDAVIDAPTMLSVLLEEPWRAAELLAAWRELLHTQAPRLGPALWDLIPHNILVDNSMLRPIDLEWKNDGASVPVVIERGLLVLGHYLTEAGWCGAADGGTMRELAGWLGVLLGLEPTFVDTAMAREVEFATIASCGTEYGTAEVRAAIAHVWRKRAEQRVRVTQARVTNG